MFFLIFMNLIGNYMPVIPPKIQNSPQISKKNVDYFTSQQVYDNLWSIC